MVLWTPNSTLWLHTEGILDVQDGAWLEPGYLVNMGSQGAITVVFFQGHVCFRECNCPCC